MRTATRLLIAMIAIMAVVIGTPNVMMAQEVEAVVEGGGALSGFLTGALTIIGPTIVAIVAVPTWDLLKRVTSLKDKLPAIVQQIMVPLLAYGLTWLGALTNTILPESLELFTPDHIYALMSAAMAFGIKAGKQAKPKSGTL